MTKSFQKNSKFAMLVLVAAMTQASFAQTNASPPTPKASEPVGTATNPFGTVKAANGAPQITYAPDANNINGDKKIVIPDKLSAAANSNQPMPTNIPQAQSIPNPAAAQQSAGIPMQTPAGLPQDAQYQQRPQGEVNPIEATLNILNTPNSRIRELNRDLYQKGRVINEGPTSAPKSVNGFVTAHLAPGSTSPVVRVAKNRTTTIVMTDMAGQPWPILNYDGLSEEDFIVKRLDKPGPDGFVLSVTPKGAFVTGNLVLVLKDLNSTISIDFVPAQKEVDSRSEIRVQAKGPNTQLMSIGLPSSLDTSLLSILQGVDPAGTKELKVSTAAVQAWSSRDGSMYVRTRYKIMSPAFENVTSSPDGTYAYKMIPVPVVLYKADEGRIGEFSIEGF
jgi:intracellular multiplication protein IcmK